MREESVLDTNHSQLQSRQLTRKPKQCGLKPLGDCQRGGHPQWTTGCKVPELVGLTTGHISRLASPDGFAPRGTATHASPGVPTVQGCLPRRAVPGPSAAGGAGLPADPSPRTLCKGIPTDPNATSQQTTDKQNEVSRRFVPTLYLPSSQRTHPPPPWEGPGLACGVGGFGPGAGPLATVSTAASPGAGPPEAPAGATAPCRRRSTPSSAEHSASSPGPGTGNGERGRRPRVWEGAEAANTRRVKQLTAQTRWHWKM